MFLAGLAGGMVNSIAGGGSFITFPALMAAGVPPIAANHMMVKNITVQGVNWGGYMRFKPQVLTESLKTLIDWYQAGRLKPHISHIVPFEQAVEGLDLLRTRKSTGKVVITL